MYLTAAGEDVEYAAHHTFKHLILILTIKTYIPSKPSIFLKPHLRTIDNWRRKNWQFGYRYAKI